MCGRTDPIVIEEPVGRGRVRGGRDVITFWIRPTGVEETLLKCGITLQYRNIEREILDSLDPSDRFESDLHPCLPSFFFFFLSLRPFQKSLLLRPKQEVGLQSRTKLFWGVPDAFSV